MTRKRPPTHTHPRLIAALVIGFLTGFALPDSWQLVTRILTGWNALVWAYLLQMGWLMVRADHARIKAIAEKEDNNAVVILVVLSIAAILSLVAIVFELSSAKGLTGALKFSHYFFTAITVLGSWLLVATTYTFHYARLFYRSPENHRWLHFPDDELHPDYWDFMYFSFTIAVAAQTSDVTVMASAMRKPVLAQSLLSFLFNAAIIGLSINIAAGMVGG
ncbi:putative membrane protein [Actimicrobium sp. GrIS 1.19]|uniref:DUF1345 domain-containing protein n=1 Tax=Actimicrobium sp. GrIS 1.19 TaxID=3071708 RepID=UPI002E03DC15|nr:putative membrane protein [Actimicrobium sp. GrIS 1.19]